MEATLSEKPLISVHMITYNHEFYVAQAIESILNQQTDFKYELVIGEDCSTDNTRSVILGYQNKFPDIIRVITSDANVGMHQNSIRTTNACQGKYMAYCEGDDYWHNTNKLQVQVDFLEANPDYVMVHSNVNCFYMDTNTLNNKCVTHNTLCDDANAFYDILTGNRSVCTCTVCIRTDLIINIIAELRNQNDPQFLMADLQLWLEISRMGKVYYLNDDLATYRILSESASHSKDISKLLQFSYSAHALRCYYLKKYNCPDDIAKKVVTKYSLDLLKSAIWARNREIADIALGCLLKYEIVPSLSLLEKLSYWGLRGKLNNQLIDTLRKIYKFINKYLVSNK